MKANIALGLAAASLLAACASSPTWDTSVFPAQVVYGAESTPAAPVVAEQRK